METIEYSVIIPTHGRDELLAKAVLSAASQECVREIIVVDDLHSTKTEQLVADLSSEIDVPVRYRPKRSDTRNGPSASRNYGAGLSTAPWLAFLDDDDEWLPGYLRNVTVAIQAQAGARGCVSWGWISDGLGNRYPGYSAELSGHTRRSRMKNPGVTGSNFVIERATFQNIGEYDPDLTFGEDLDLLLRCLDVDVKFAVAKTRAYVYNDHGAGHLSSRTKRRYDALAAYRSKREVEDGRPFSFGDLRLYHWQRFSAARGDWRPRHLRLAALLAQVIVGFPRPLLDNVLVRLTRQGAVVGDNSLDVV